MKRAKKTPTTTTPGDAPQPDAPPATDTPTVTAEEPVVTTADTEVPEPGAPLLKVNFDFHREFRKHFKTGEIVAVELVNGALNGVRHCTRPEEQTAGALPVMALEDRESAVGEWYRAEILNFKTWEPAPLPQALMDNLSALYEESVEARTKLENAKLRMKAAKTKVEDVDERIFQLLRRLHEMPDQADLPLEPEPPLPLEAEMSDETANAVLAIIAPGTEALDPAEERAGDSSVETPEPGLEPGAAEAELGEQESMPPPYFDFPKPEERGTGA